MAYRAIIYNQTFIAATQDEVEDMVLDYEDLNDIELEESGFLEMEVEEID